MLLIIIIPASGGISSIILLLWSNSEFDFESLFHEGESKAGWKDEEKWASPPLLLRLLLQQDDDADIKGARRAGIVD